MTPKSQLGLMLRELYLHPSGQLPAYEWNFGDVNPPVHAWATLAVYETELERARRRRRGLVEERLPEAAGQLHLVDQPQGPDRTQRVRGRVPRPGQHRRVRPQRPIAHGRPPRAIGRHRLDGVLLAVHARDRPRAVRARPAVRRHGAQVRRALRSSSPPPWTGSATTRTRCGTRRTASSTTSCGSPTDRQPGSRCGRWSGCFRCALRRSCPIEGIKLGDDLVARLRRRIESMPELLATIHDARQLGVNGRRMLAVLDETKLRRILARMLDENEFLSPHGLRALSRYHEQHPFSLEVDGHDLRGPLPSRRIRHAGCSAATRTGAGPSGSPSTISCCGRCCTCTRTTATTSPSNVPPVRGTSARCSRSQPSSAGG